MKTRTLIAFFIICLAVSIFVGSCATTHNPDKMVLERFCGTWANPAYEHKPGEYTPVAKIIINPDGTYLRYQRMDEAGVTGAGYYTVEKRWTDSEGNIYYHITLYLPYSQRTFYLLAKVDRFNMVWENQFSNIDYPTEINPKDWHTTYRVYYRY